MNVELRGFNIEDARELAAVVDNKKLLDNLRDGIPFPYTEEDAKEFIGMTLAAEKDSQYIFAIVYGGKIVGCVGVTRQENVHRLTGELGYYVAESYWGLGIMTEAVKQICSFIFTKTDIIRIFAGVFSFNTASCRVLEKAGFEFEGVQQKNVIKNNKVTNTRMYALIRPDSEKTR